MNDQSFERNSRTLKQARRGQMEVFLAIVGALVSVIAAVSGFDRIVQIVVGGACAFILVLAYFRFVRVKKFRRQDHACGLNRKPEDEY